MPATIRIIDFRDDEEPGFVGGRSVPRQPVLNDKAHKKQIRQRVRRRGKMTQAEFEVLYKPLDEWDMEELARGRPRDKNGNFQGRQTQWLTRQMHENILAQFNRAIKGGMNVRAVQALDVLQLALLNEDVDPRGRPIVPWSVKLDAAKFLLEHVVGKPTVHVEADVNHKIVAMLAAVSASPVDGRGGEALDDPTGLAGTSDVHEFADRYGLYQADGEILDAEVVEEDDDD